jgi:uncharacterized protein (TIGR03083 family)
MSRSFTAGISEKAYAEALDILEAEFNALKQTVAGIKAEDWARPTRLRVSASHPYWDVFTLVAHHNVATHMVQDLVADQRGGTPNNDHTTFFVTNAAEVAPAVDEFTRNSAKGLSPEQLRQTLMATIDEALRVARATDQGKVGFAFFGPMRLDELMPTRIIETAVHGLDLTAALGKPPHLTARARQSCVAQLEELLQHRRGIARPADLRDDIAFIEVACGRRSHGDARFPILQ